MPSLKLIFRRTITTTVNPLFPPPNNHQQTTINLKRTTNGRRHTLAKVGARLSVDVAHVKPPSFGPNNNNKNNNNRLYIINNANLLFSSSSYNFPSSLVKKKRENNNKIRVSEINSKIDMGHENKKEKEKEKEKENGFVSNEQEKCSKLLTLPTLLTLARVAAIPVFITTFYINNWWGTAATTSIFIIAAITDWLDGYLARKMGLGTAFGAFLDPVADKLMVAATLVLLCSRPPVTAILGDLPWLFPVPAIAIIGREITMSAVREWAASQNTKLLQAVAVNNLGKWKTATQMTALTIILASRDSSLADPGGLLVTGVALLYISAGLAVWSLVVYMKKIWKVLLK